MDVAGQDPEIRLVLDQLGPVAALEEVPAMAVATSPPVGYDERNSCMPLARLGAGDLRTRWR